MEEIKALIGAKKYSELKNNLISLNEADTAAVLEELPKDWQMAIFRLLPKDQAAEVFAFLPRDIQQELIKSLTNVEVTEILDSLMADDAADLMDEMPSSVVTQLLANTTADTRRTINHLLKFPEDSAGSIMTVEFVDLKETLTLEQSLERIRDIGLDKETVNTCYVLDPARKLVGTVTLRSIIMGKPDTVIRDIMEENVISVDTLTDQEDVAHTMSKYDFTSLPVVDSENRLVGIITIDDVVDIIQEEATEDIQKMAAIVPTETPYVKTSAFVLWRKRIVWLLLLMVSATFTGGIIGRYEAALSAFIVLTAYIPMLMDTGGNAGAQSSTTIIRAMSLNEISKGDVLKTLGKEILTSFLCGISLSAANFVKLLVIDRLEVSVAAVICLTLVVTVMAANMVGVLLPLAANKVGLDPTVMASPLITTIVDALSLLIYFEFATTLLHIVT
ncbi:MAG: magnesium transporter [Lachnospiraceae bacterium]|nr:magnesium transporter [Lachnospiraceae bacterium]